jgi:large subunit ribosomal protein L22
MADAEHNFQLDAGALTVKEAVIGIGPALKRFKPRAKGSAGAIRRPTSHIFITLTDAEAPAKKAKSAKVSK